jgi:hypothetical protein
MGKMNQEDPTVADYEKEIDEFEPIPQLKNYRKKQAENRLKEEELEMLKAQRKELEIQLNLQKEKARIEKIKNQLDGKVYCDDCKTWVYPAHFEEN